VNALKRFVIVVPVTSTGEVVMYRGKKGWELPGGSIEEGETPEEAALRELFEECGIEASQEDLMFIGTIKDKSGEGYIFGLLIDKDTRLGDSARLFKRLPVGELAYPLYETMALINTTIMKITIQKGGKHGRS